MRMRWPFFGVLAWGYLAIGLTPAWAQTLGDDDVILRQSIDTRYEALSDELDAILPAAGSRTTLVLERDTVSSIIAQRFGVGPTTSPEAYREFEAFIAASNDLSDASELRAGDTLDIPDLPRIALRRPNSQNPFNTIPKLAFDGRLRLALGAPEGDDGLVVTEDGRRGAAEAVVYRLLDSDKAQEVHALDPNSEPVAVIMPFSYAERGSTAIAHSGELLPPTDEAFLRTQLSRPKHQSPIVIILDDAWPTDAAFVNARDFFAVALAQLRRHWGIPTSSFSRRLASSTGTEWLRTPLAAESHAQQIAEALTPLQALEPADGRVRVYYLPMISAQRGAAEILQQLIAFDGIRSTISDRANRVQPDIIRGQNEIAQAVVNRLDRAEGFVAQRSDLAVIQAVLAFCENYSLLTSQACYVSMSWTTDEGRYRPRLPDGGYGFPIAAAGNEGSSSNGLYGSRRDFAARSKAPGNILAVMNLDDDGAPACGSTVLGDYTTAAFAVGFSGEVRDGVCGTSFSAPRVAWLLAARESVRPAPADIPRWRDQMWSEITRRAGPTGPDYGRLGLDIRSLFLN